MARQRPQAGSQGIAVRPFSPSIRGKYCALQPVRPTSVNFLYELLLENLLGFAWRFRGATPTLDQFTAELQNDVFAHFLVVHNSEEFPLGEAVGYVGGYSLDVRNGHAHLMIAMRQSARMSPVAVDACMAFMEFAFSQWPLRKIYIDRPASIGRISAVERYCDQEGVLREHLFLGGEYVDQYLFSLTREAFRQLDSRYRGSTREQNDGPISEH
jgi:RimJ/RimL family protein N-acetyltransferase